MKLLTLLALLLTITPVFHTYAGEDCEAINDGSRSTSSTTVIESNDEVDAEGNPIR